MFYCTGATSTLSPVVNLTATYEAASNTVSVEWEDEDNMFTTDGNFIYHVSYNVSVAGVLLLSNSAVVTPTDVAETSFSHTISEGDFLQAGVTVDVRVLANTSSEESSPESATDTVPGSEYE